MLLPPLPGALAAGFGVFGIGSEPSAVILGSALPLAFRLAANGLVRLVLGRLKCLLAIPATPLDHEGVVAFPPTTI
jgi:hypothetical protein